MMRRLALRTSLLCVVLAAAGAQAAPVLRKVVDQKGDFVIFGNTVGYDCTTAAPLTPPPLVGTVGACGSNVTDTAPDVFWRSEFSGPGTAQADTSITPAMARSTAELVLPANAVITYARLYWAAEDTNAIGLNRANVTLDRPGSALTASITALAGDIKTSSTTGPVGTFYQSNADVTKLVQTWGTGTFRISGIGTIPFLNVDDTLAFIGWSMVVVYSLDTDPPRNIALFDGFDLVAGGSPANINLSGFLVPNAGFDGKLGVVAYEGDNAYNGDSLLFNTVALTNAENPPDNFFNSSRSRLGVPDIHANDLPKLDGHAGSMSGLDLDVVNVTPQLKAGDKTATIQGTASTDRYFLGALVTSISTLKPIFTDTSKTYTNVSGGSLRPGSIIEYTISTHNTGTDTGVDVVMSDPLPVGVTYVPGSLQIASGYNAGALTDAAGDDQGDYVAGSRTVVVRLGSGANAAQGGALTTADALQVIKFRVTIDAGASGTIANQATITSSGQTGKTQGIGPVGFPSSDGGNGNGTPTTFIVDACATNADCSGSTPYCNTATHPYVCVNCLGNANCANPIPYCAPATQACSACVSDASCTTPTQPACQTSGPLAGSCTQCSATNTSQCTGATPTCDTARGVCVGCTSNANCSGTKPICDTASGVCVGCTTNANCGGATPTCDPTQHICVSCTSNANCSGTTPYCNTGTGVCQACIGNGAPSCTDATHPACLASGACGQCGPSSNVLCMGATPACDTVAGVCVQCVSNSGCVGTTPTCNLGSHTCGPCTGDGAPSCSNPTLPACQTSGPLSGACTQCSASNKSQCTGNTTVCELGTGTCVQCVDNSKCSGATPTCDTAGHTCIPCAGDGAPSCTNPGQAACNASGPLNGQCTQCSANNASACTGTTPLCNTATGVCVGCLDSSTCPGTAPVCNPATHTCGVCTSDASCVDPSHPACSTSGAKAGTCTQCSGSNKSQCTGATTACDVTNGVCVQCADDTTCGGATPVCNKSTHTCGACSSDSSCATSPGGHACQPSGPLTGQCTQCSASNTAACTGATPACDTTRGVCVACVNSSTCGGATPVCDQTAHTCVACSATDATRACADPTKPVCQTSGTLAGQCTQCSGANKGQCTNATAACDTGSGTCVECTADTDCPADRAACDTASHVCQVPVKPGAGDFIAGGGCGCQGTGSGASAASGGALLLGSWMLLLALARRRAIR